MSVFVLFFSFFFFVITFILNLDLISLFKFFLHCSWFVWCSTIGIQTFSYIGYWSEPQAIQFPAPIFFPVNYSLTFPLHPLVLTLTLSAASPPPPSLSLPLTVLPLSPLFCSFLFCALQFICTHSLTRSHSHHNTPSVSLTPDLSLPLSCYAFFCTSLTHKHTHTFSRSFLAQVSPSSR